MSQPQFQPSEKSRQSSTTRHPNTLKEFIASPIDFIMENPKLTPTILLTLAITPIVVLTAVAAAIFLGQ